MPPPSRTGTASNRSLQARFTRKVGPLPVWGWAAVILGAYLLYSRLHPAKVETTAVPTDGTAGDGTAQQPASGQGSAADNWSGDLLDALGANSAAIDALTLQLQQGQVDSHPLSPGTEGVSVDPTVLSLPTDWLPGWAPPHDPATPAAAPSPSGTAAGAVVSPHQTQTRTGILSWDGVNFTTKSAFDKWARTHGTSSAAIFKTHPQAQKLYGTLKP